MKLLKSLIFIVVCLGAVPAWAAGDADASGLINLNSLHIDTLWVLIAAALVFFMQAGFKAFEVGVIKQEHRDAIGLKNLIDWVVGSLAFFLIGFGLMFGKSNGIFGTDLFFGINILGNEAGSPLGFVFFLFQVGFAATALTIISGAMSGRTGFLPYLTGSVITVLIIYPIFGHWAWGNLFYADNPAWLADMGFMDFAGSTVVHSVGAWVSLVGIYLVGPRIGRYDAEGNVVGYKGYNYAYSIMGVLILWLGWWGFNGGSTLALNDDVGLIILNTNIAGAAAGVVAFFHSYFFQKKAEITEKLLGGCLGGLVAITACCNVVTPMGALLVGALAGFIHNVSLDLLVKKMRLDDAVGAIPVHGVCGAFGTLAVALFGQQELLALPRFEQLGIQALGVGICLVFTVVMAFIMFRFLKSTVGLRVSPQEERTGDTFGLYGEESTEEEEVDEEALKKLMQEMEGGTK